MKFKLSSKAIMIFVGIMFAVVLYFVVCGQSLDATKDYILTNIKGLLVIVQAIAIGILLIFKRWWAAAFLGLTVMITLVGVRP